MENILKSSVSAVGGVENIIKAIIAVLGGVISYITGRLGVFPILLFTLMFIDFATGVQASKITGKDIKASIGFQGLIRKSYILLLVGSIYAIEFAIAYTTRTPELNDTVIGAIDIMGLSGLAGSGMAFLFAIMEFVSIIENGMKMGAKLPTPLLVIFEKLSKYLNGEDEGETQDAKNS